MVALALNLLRRSARHSDVITEVLIITAFSLAGLVVSLALAHLGFDVTGAAYD